MSQGSRPILGVWRNFQNALTFSTRDLKKVLRCVLPHFGERTHQRRNPFCSRAANVHPHQRFIGETFANKEGGFYCVPTDDAPEGKVSDAKLAKKYLKPVLQSKEEHAVKQAKYLLAQVKGVEERWKKHLVAPHAEEIHSQYKQKQAEQARAGAGDGTDKLTIPIWFLLVTVCLFGYVLYLSIKKKALSRKDLPDSVKRKFKKSS